MQQANVRQNQVDEFARAFAGQFHLFSTIHPQTAGETYMGGALQGRGGARRVSNH